uniref:ATP-binding cassette sub-family A member 3-like n=1 Tax=Marmota marmota marmota TaxID=9994 RepID=A0A8C5Z6R0_MARMA
MAVFKKLKLLLWKNFILKKRRILMTVLEILMPLLFSAVVLYLRFNSVPRKRAATNYSAIDVSSLPDFFHQFPVKNKFQLVYIPSKSETLKALTEMVEDTFDVEFEVLGFSSMSVFESYKINDPKAFYILVGIVFDHNFNDSREPLPLGVKYNLRFSYIRRNFASMKHAFLQEDSEGWCTSFLYPPNLSYEPREFAFTDGGIPGYYKEGFLGIQHAVDKAIMHHHARNASADMFERLNMLLQRFPHGPHIQDGFFLVLQNEFPLFLMLSFICIELIIINTVLLEKERKLKEYMYMMGLNSWLHWVAWFITFFISVFIAVSIMTILFCTEVENMAVFKNRLSGVRSPLPLPIELIFVFLMCFAVATIFFAFMISTFFQRAHVGTASGGIIFFFTYLPYLYLTFSYHQRSYFEKITFCLFSNVAMAMGVHFISMFEAKSTGIQWKNMGSIRGEFSFIQVMLMLLLDSLLYCIITWYVESIFPGKFGIPKPWYFFAMPIPVTHALLDMGDPNEAPKKDHTLTFPQVFYRRGNAHIAVKDLRMNLYRGQITVLLGHNGAGKTTTCSMLTGLISPSSGQAYINGYEISKDMVQIRKSIGWCPQHNILFDNFIVLKGLSQQKCPEEVKQMLHILNLEDKRNSRSKFLSGGMKCKLSIGIALIVGSKVLMLDEPTSGMDAISRRAIWDLLQKQKSDRTILLTTHFMDEADLLGDRIAIMAKGELQCCGSSLFLKQKYGAGYYMTLLRNPYCDTEKISHLIYHHIPNAVMESSVGEELIFIFPKEFESLFTDLEMKQTELGITSFGASVTTMEEVFVRVCMLADYSTDISAKKQPSIHPHSLISRVPVERIKYLHSRIFSLQTGLPITLNTGFSLLCQQFYAMFLKRVIYSRRNWMVMLPVQILVPLVIIILSLTFFNFKMRSMGSVPLQLALNTYGQTIVPFFVSQNFKLDPQLSDHFANMLVAQGQIPLEVPGPVEEFLLKKAEAEPEDFNRLYVVAVSFEDVDNHTIVRGLFNNQAYHSPALALTLVDNYLFKLLSGARASITVSNPPQPQTAMEFSENVLYQGPKGHYLIINLLFGMAFLSSSFSMLTVRERRIKAKHIQFISGVYMAAFWFSAMLWDLLSFLVCTLLLIVSAELPGFYTPISVTECLSTQLGSVTQSPVRLASHTEWCWLGYTEISESSDHTFLILPGHCLGMAFSNLYYNFELQKFCNSKNLSQIECKEVSEGHVIQKNIYAWESLGIGKYLAALAISGPLYIILLFLVETKVFRRLKARISNFFLKLLAAASVPEDQDVEEEAKTVRTYLETLQKTHPLIVKEVSKVYIKKVPLLAVNKVSFTAQAKECFGLLGINGAGKTSIFKMLTGQKPITCEDAFIRGLSISSDLGKVRQWIGYCPQFDALLSFMTGRETLVMYARIRGIPEHHISSCVDQILEDLVMFVYADKLVKTYSGGNKRKLSTAIALIGDPAVIFLDEPSTGMDPMARRLLWGTVGKARESGKAIELKWCEALCTRLAIMVQGQFKCLGSPQHLKSKFGSGYSLWAKVRREGQQEALEEFKAFVDLTFSGSVLEEEHQGMVHYHLPGNDLSWGKVFGILEQAKKKYLLEDYLVNQISLEDIFLNFASPVPPTQGTIQQEQAEPDRSSSPSLPCPQPCSPPSQPLLPSSSPPSQPPLQSPSSLSQSPSLPSSEPVLW